MAELSYIIKQNYKSSFDTLKHTSYDKENSVYMCQSSMKVVDFDHLTKDLYPQKQPSSYDSLIIDEETKKVFCVEFKNQQKSHIKNTELHKKVKNSDETIRYICSEYNVAKSDYTFILCVVYKENPSNYRYRRFEKNIIHFELDVYTGKYFSKIITNDIDFFKKEFDKKFGCI
jgi:hypothetical protein